LAHVHFSASVFALPLKSAENPRGIFSEQELYMIVAVIFTAIFFDFEPTKSFPLRKVAQKVATMLGKLIEANVQTVTATSFASTFIDGFRENHNALADCELSFPLTILACCDNLSVRLEYLSLLFLSEANLLKTAST
jgi:linoleate 10R-lipoxygenase